MTTCTKLRPTKAAELLCKRASLLLATGPSDAVAGNRSWMRRSRRQNHTLCLWWWRGRAVRAAVSGMCGYLMDSQLLGLPRNRHIRNLWPVPALSRHNDTLIRTCPSILLPPSLALTSLCNTARAHVLLLCNIPCPRASALSFPINCQSGAVPMETARGSIRRTHRSRNLRPWRFNRGLPLN